MKYFIISVCFLFCHASLLAQNATEAIQEVFKNYKNAIMTDRESEAIGYMDSRTLEYYKNILNLVRSADSLTLERQPLLDKFTILNIRHIATKKQILAFDDKSIIAFVIKNGMMGKNTLEGFELGKIIVKDKTAKAMIVVDGKKSTKFYNFYSDGTKWKIDFTSLFPAEEKETRQIIKDSGKSENEFILGILEIMSEKKVSPNIWKKIK
ncbi:MAG TPA: hypothetical protein VFG10_00460 [Saprospiraceae bacterium]|nr:hypothetical protein [Saprospiraceae bacterium]